MKSALFVLAPGFLAISLASAPVHAATASASFTVSATVLSSCAASASSKSFRTAQGDNAALSVKCSHPTPYNVELSAGRAFDPAAAGGPGTGGIGNGSIQTLSVRQVPASQHPEGDPYRDTVVMTVTY